MYYETRGDRVLLRDGRSITSPSQFAKALIEGRDFKGEVMESFDTEAYKTIYGVDLGSGIEEVEVESDHYQTDEMADTLIEVLQSKPRFNPTDEFMERLEIELDFFQRTSNISFILRLNDLIDQFKEDGVVWGVGRGSGCSSLVLYILEVHDVDPLLYDIGFHELSKEYL